MVVRLARLRQAYPEDEERTYTDNISTEGARVFSRHHWEPGEQAEIAPVKEETPVRGEVIYCQKLASDRFFIGVKFLQHPFKWSALSRFDGR